MSPSDTRAAFGIQGPVAFSKGDARRRRRRFLDRGDPINVTAFSVTSHEPFPCDAKLSSGGEEEEDSRLKDTRCIGIVPLATRDGSHSSRDDEAV